MKLTIRDEAGDEAAYYFAWFRARNRQVGDRLSELFVETIGEIARRPATGIPRKSRQHSSRSPEKVPAHHYLSVIR